MPAVPFCLLFLASSSWIIIIMAHSSSNHLFFSLLSISYLLAGQCSLILFMKMLMLPCYQSLLHQHHHPCIYLLRRHEPINLLQHSWQDAATSQSLCLNSSEPHFLCKPLNIKKSMSSTCFSQAPFSATFTFSFATQSKMFPLLIFRKMTSSWPHCWSPFSCLMVFPASSSAQSLSYYINLIFIFASYFICLERLLKLTNSVQ